jgi:hypothetical protein
MIPSDVINTIAAKHPVGHLSNTSMKKNPFPAWSALDDVKHKADSIANEASREFDLASQKAQEKTGKIQPGSLKYYAACTFGGILACVSTSFYLEGHHTCVPETLTDIHLTGPHPYRCDSSRSDQMPSPS